MFSSHCSLLLPVKMAASSPYLPVASLPPSFSPSAGGASLHPIRVACHACDVTSCLTSHMHGQTCGLDVGGVDFRAGGWEGCDLVAMVAAACLASMTIAISTT